MNPKRENFERLAQKRVSEVIKKIRLISNLSNRNNYDFTDDQVKQIIDVLESEVKVLRSKFRQDNDIDNVNFRFKV